MLTSVFNTATLCVERDFGLLTSIVSKPSLFVERMLTSVVSKPSLCVERDFGLWTCCQQAIIVCREGLWPVDLCCQQAIIVCREGLWPVDLLSASHHCV